MQTVNPRSNLPCISLKITSDVGSPVMMEHNKLWKKVIFGKCVGCNWERDEFCSRLGEMSLKNRLFSTWSAYADISLDRNSPGHHARCRGTHLLSLRCELWGCDTVTLQVPSWVVSSFHWLKKEKRTLDSISQDSINQNSVLLVF